MLSCNRVLARVSKEWGVAVSVDTLTAYPTLPQNGWVMFSSTFTSVITPGTSATVRSERITVFVALVASGTSVEPCVPDPLSSEPLLLSYR
jgi:hypothetical protein